MKVGLSGGEKEVPEEFIFSGAVKLGRDLAKAGYEIVTGAGAGYTGKALDGYISSGGKSAIGYSPFSSAQKHIEAGFPLVVGATYNFCENGARRNAVVGGQDILIAMPGGTGTLHEILSALLVGRPVLTVGEEFTMRVREAIALFKPSDANKIVQFEGVEQLEEMVIPDKIEW